LARLRELVEAVQRPALAGAVPRAEELDTVDVQGPGRVDTDRRARRKRRMHEHAAGHEDPRRMPVGPVEEVAVDADDRRLARDVLLDLRHALAAAHHRAAAEHRGELIEPGRIGLRRGDHVQHDRAMRGELHDLLVGDARHQFGRCGGVRRRSESRQEQDNCRDAAQHNPGRD